MRCFGTGLRRRARLTQLEAAHLEPGAVGNSESGGPLANWVETNGEGSADDDVVNRIVTALVVE